MSGLIMGGAALFAIALVIFSKSQKKRATRKALARDGFSFARPKSINDYTEIGSFARKNSCPYCEGELRIMGEDSAHIEGKALHVARTKCERCDEKTPLIFEVSQVPN